MWSLRSVQQAVAPRRRPTPGHKSTRAVAPLRVAFHQFNGVGSRNERTSAAQWLAYALPYRRFADALTGACARLGADAGRSGRIVARTRLRMMLTFPRSPYHSARRVFLVTAGRLACQAGPSRHSISLSLLPAYTDRRPVCRRPSCFSVDPAKVGSVDAITAPP